MASTDVPSEVKAPLTVFPCLFNCTFVQSKARFCFGKKEGYLEQLCSSNYSDIMSCQFLVKWGVVAILEFVTPKNK